MLWVILITDGTTIEYVPELYDSRDLAEREARRWAWLLSSGGEFEVRTPFEGRWEVADQDIRLVPVTVARVPSDGDLWIGSHWTKDGHPDPEAVLLESRSGARDWVITPPAGHANPSSHAESEFELLATFGSGDHESFSVAYLAKLVCDRL